MFHGVTVAVAAILGGAVGAAATTLWCIEGFEVLKKRAEDAEKALNVAVLISQARAHEGLKNTAEREHARLRNLLDEAQASGRRNGERAKELAVQLAGLQELHSNQKKTIIEELNKNEALRKKLQETDLLCQVVGDTAAYIQNCGHFDRDKPWQSMKTLKKQHVNVMGPIQPVLYLTDKKEVKLGFLSRWENRDTQENFWCKTVCGRYEEIAINWMPLPEPPK